MRTKLKFSFLFLSLLLFIALALVGVKAGELGYRNLLMVLPKSADAAFPEPERMAELGEEFILTYERPTPVMVKALRSQWNVTAIGTNENYAALMGYPLLCGGFLTESAVRNRERFAVLEENTAFQMFGALEVAGLTFEMDGAVWLIVGVVKEPGITGGELKIYLPATCLKGAPNALLARVGSDETAVLAGLKTLGIHESTHWLLSLNGVGGAIWGRFTVAGQAAVCGAIVLLMGKGVLLLKGRARLLKARLRQVYLPALIAQNPRELALIGGVLLLLAAGIALLVFTVPRILETCLNGKESLQGFRELSGQWFGGKIGGFQKLQQWSAGLLAGFLPAYTMFLLFAAKR
ncbi:MAG: ABC transporter permease [Christensenellaceae bacterium]|nr:ABC transporter permease [Christensenellaceae bacterium]